MMDFAIVSPFLGLVDAFKRPSDSPPSSSAESLYTEPGSTGSDDVGLMEWEREFGVRGATMWV